MTSPRVTVVMPVWNGALFVGEAIESVLAQDFTDLELLLVDDASTDATPGILAGWAARDPRVRVIRNEVNLGSPASRNRGIEEGRGEYVACHDADDLSLPGRFTLEVAALDADPGAPMVTMNYRFVDHSGAFLRTERRDQPPEIVDLLLTFTNPIGGHSQVMFRREAVRGIGGYDESHRFGEDADLWPRLARVGRILMLPQLGMCYRQHGQQKTLSRAREERRGRSVARSRLLLSGYLGREVGEDDAAALMHAWHGGSAPFDGAAADGLLREAHAVFSARHGGNRTLQRRLRHVIGSRLAITAGKIAMRRPLAGLGLFVRALRWSAAAALAAPLGQAADTIAFRLRSRRTSGVAG